MFLRFEVERLRELRQRIHRVKHTGTSFFGNFPSMNG